MLTHNPVTIKDRSSLGLTLHPSHNLYIAKTWVLKKSGLLNTIELEDRRQKANIEPLSYLDEPWATT